MKRCSISSLLEKRKCEVLLHIWSEWPSSKNLQTINAGEGVEKREPFCTVGGNVNWHNHYGQQYGSSFKKVKLELPYDIEILDIHLEKTII